jgi:DnaK suppressor protein
MDRLVLSMGSSARAAGGTVMKSTSREIIGVQEILERKEAELLAVLRQRDGIVIEKSADQMDEIQYASERDLAIRNVDRESSLLRQVKAALRRARDGSFGTCMECESAIGPKRLAAVPWALRCIQCQSAAERDQRQETDSVSETLVKAA